MLDLCAGQNLDLQASQMQNNSVGIYVFMSPAVKPPNSLHLCQKECTQLSDSETLTLGDSSLVRN